MKYLFFLIFISIHIFSKAQRLEKYSPKYICEDLKAELIENRLYAKKYYRKLFEIKDTILASKEFYVYYENIDVDENINFHIEVDFDIKGILTDNLKWTYLYSKEEIYQLFIDLEELIYKKSDNCFFKKYYFQVDYNYNDGKKEYVRRDSFWIEKKQLENFSKNKNKKELFEILDIQYEE